MDKSVIESTLQELQSFRSQLFVLDSDEEASKHEMRGILDKYQGDNFLPFAEEYLIAGFDVSILNDESMMKVEKLTKNGQLPSIENGDVTFWDRDRLLFCLVFDNEEAFSKGLKLIVAKNPKEISKFNIEIKDENKSDSESEMEDMDTLDTWRNVSLIKVAVFRELNSAIGQLGSLNSEINFSTIHLVYEFGHWECLGYLLQKRKSKRWKPVRLTEFISFLIKAQSYDKDFYESDESPNKKPNFSKCVDLLFKYAEYDINEQDDDHHSALHLAVTYSKTKIIIDLLKKGAYIGVCDKMERPAIWNINPKTLENYFDSCIEGEEIIVFNFENLITPSDDYPNDMVAIECISNSTDLKYLLEHPLIASFLFVKWNRLALIFYLDFLCYFLLSLSIGCISMYYIKSPFDHIFKMSIFTLLFIIYVSLRRSLQVIFCSPNHRRSLETYLYILLTILIAVLLVLFVIAVPFDFHCSTLAAICIILITYEFFTLAGTFWHFSIYSEMFIAVARSSIKSLQLYAIFLPAFSLLFYILLRDKNLEIQDDDKLDFNKFPSFGATVVKTIVMSAGEFDVINVNFNTISLYIFIGFLFLITIVFMNLLNGLAVSDTNKIQFKAELTSFKRRCQVLARYEEVLSNKHHWFRSRYQGIWAIFKRFTQFNTFVYRDKRIYIELYEKWEVYSVKKTSSNVICLRVPLRSWSRVRNARMTSKIIRHALEIREKHEKNFELEKCENERDQLVTRIVKIEKTLRKMEATLNSISKKLNRN